MRYAALTSTSGLSLPADTYIYRFAPIDAALAAISSDDSLRVFDAETLQLVSGGVFDNVHDGVTCLKTTGSEPKMLFTAGRDGFIRSWDLRIGKKAWELRDGIRMCSEIFGHFDLDSRTFSAVPLHCYHLHIAYDCSRDGACSIASNNSNLVRLATPLSNFILTRTN